MTGRYIKITFAFLFFISCFNDVAAGGKLKITLTEGQPDKTSKQYQSPIHPSIQYTGRIEKANAALPRFWSPGVYIRLQFSGDLCEIFLNDEVLYGTSHNYIEIIIDEMEPARIQTRWKNNQLKIEELSDARHTLTICKNTESGIGYVEFAGIDCKKLLPLPGKPMRKIEFIGNSITCGSGMGLSAVDCNKGQWYDQHNAWLSYGPSTARSLDAQWHLSAVSGIGLIHSCCQMNITMPQVFNKINMRDDSIAWDFTAFVPDVVTICLGQNDGIQDSAIFCSAYNLFIKTIREKYPKADIICLTSPMGDAALTAVLKNYLQSVVASINKTGDTKVHTFFFAKRYHDGCGGHPGLQEHQQIAAELTACIKKIKSW